MKKTPKKIDREDCEFIAIITIIVVVMYIVLKLA